MLARMVTFAAPAALLLLIPACDSRQRPNQRQRLVSPSGKYVLTVPIETNAGRGGSDAWWTVTISDRQGNQLYKDDDSDFAGWLSAYWAWDPADRVWLYNSDDGRVFFWEAAAPTTKASGQSASPEWIKAEWDETDPQLEARGLRPPTELYPEYLRDMK